jgi:hypothetical protein
MGYCPDCGVDVEDDASYCSECGADLTSSSSSSDSHTETADRAESEASSSPDPPSDIWYTLTFVLTTGGVGFLLLGLALSWVFYLLVPIFVIASILTMALDIRAIEEYWDTGLWGWVLAAAIIWVFAVPGYLYSRSNAV